MAKVDIPLDYSREQIRRLFSHPANCHEVCFLDKSLEDTVKYYLNLSLQRDGIRAEVQDMRIKDGDKKFVRVVGENVERYKTMLPALLRTGEIALKISRALPKVLASNQTGWRYNWRFFLPLGLAMTEHRSVQLLHFPPDSVLERDQDYLAASTTKQWARLLAENLPDGVSAGESQKAIVDRTAQYQNIIDLAPISAPSNDGKNIDSVYLSYEPYFFELLKLWIKPNGRILPIVAFGVPVCKWVERRFEVAMRVHSVASVEVEPGVNVPVLGTNHPSYIFNADEKYQDDPGTTTVNERLVGLMLVLWEDAVSAYWQVNMAKNAKADPAKVLEDGRKEWSTEQKLDRLAVMIRELKLATFLENEDDFAPALKTLKEVVRTPEELAKYREYLDKIRAAVGSLDSRSPKAIALDMTEPLASSVYS